MTHLLRETKIDLHALDHLVWPTMVVMRHCLHSEDMEFKLSTGEILFGRVHEAGETNVQL